MSDETQQWTGDSGTDYYFYVYPCEFEIPARTGIYIYAGRNPDGLWAPLFIGYGDLSVRANGDRELAARIASKGATHVHLRLNSDAADASNEVADLLKRYTNTFEPLGCNVPDPIAAEPPSQG